jgi:Fur family peroxide stress response transcriptional regulator
MEPKLDFRELCKESGLAMTHQRQVIFDTLAVMHHPCPDEVYEQVKKAIPSISHATVYKTLHTFVEHGILRELSPHHGTLRVDLGTEPHHHLICTSCKKVIDLETEMLEPVKFLGRLPKGFQVERVAVEVQGLCDKCSKTKGQRVSKQRA